MSEPGNQPDRPRGVQTPIQWTGSEHVPISMANQFVLQVDALGDGTPDQVVLTVGQLIGPALLGTPEEIAQRIARIDALTVSTLGRYSISRARLAELITALQKMKRHLDQSEGDAPSEEES